MTDTSTDAVALLAIWSGCQSDLAAVWSDQTASKLRTVAATLRALAGERDAALSAGRTMQGQRDAAIARAEAAEAALARIAGHINVRPALGDPAA